MATMIGMHRAKYITWYHVCYKVGTIITPELQTGMLRHREVQFLAADPTVRQWWGQG